MADANQANLQQVDWSKLPSPPDDGDADHLTGMQIPSLDLPSTKGGKIDLASLNGICVVFAYPMTGRPDIALPDGWDMIPGARGCTPQACTFRDMQSDLTALGVNHIFGLSVQQTEYQTEASERLHLNFPLLSDHDGALRSILRLPVMMVEDMVLLKRLTMICIDGRIEKIFYPVFPPDRSAADVVQWLQNR